MPRANIDRAWLQNMERHAGRAGFFSLLGRGTAWPKVLRSIFAKIGVAEDCAVEGADDFTMLSLVALATDLSQRHLVNAAKRKKSALLNGMFVSEVDDMVRQLTRARSLLPLDERAAVEAAAPLGKMAEWAKTAMGAHHLVLRDLRARDPESWGDAALGAKKATELPGTVLVDLVAAFDDGSWSGPFDLTKARIERRFEYGVKAAYFLSNELSACDKLQEARVSRAAKRARRHIERYCGDGDYEPLADGFALLDADAFSHIVQFLDVSSSAALVCCCRDFSGRDWPDLALRATPIGRLLVSTLPQFRIRRIPGPCPDLRDGRRRRREMAPAMPHCVIPSVDAQGRRVLTDYVCSERSVSIIVDFGVRRPRSVPLRDGLRDVDNTTDQPDRLTPCEDQPGLGTRPKDHASRIGPWPDVPREDLLRHDHFFRVNWAAADGPREALDPAVSFERVPWSAYFLRAPKMSLFLADGESLRELAPAAATHDGSGVRRPLLSAWRAGVQVGTFSTRRTVLCGSDDKCKPYIEMLPARTTAHVLATTGGEGRRRVDAEGVVRGPAHRPKTLRLGVRIEGALRPPRDAASRSAHRSSRTYTTTIYSDPFVTVEQKRSLRSATKRGLAACAAAGV